jgi:hypothetical protein
VRRCSAATICEVARWYGVRVVAISLTRLRVVSGSRNRADGYNVAI